jgi:hypothetical protein
MGSELSRTGPLRFEFGLPLQLFVLELPELDRRPLVPLLRCAPEPGYGVIA